MVGCINSKLEYSTVRIRGKELHYREQGSGSIIVMLPPPLGDFKIYCKIQSQLSKHYKVVSINLPDNTRNLSEVVDILVEFINTGTVNPFHLLASSASGWIAQYLANRMTAKLQSLILINTFYHNKAFGKAYSVALKSTKLIPGFKFKQEVVKRTRFLFKGIENVKEIENYLKHRVNVLDKSGVRSQMSWFIESRNPPSSLQLPILHIYAKNDPIIKNTDQLQIAQAHSNVKMVEIKTNSHMLFITHQVTIIQEVQSFLNHL